VDLTDPVHQLVFDSSSSSSSSGGEEAAAAAASVAAGLSSRQEEYHKRRIDWGEHVCGLLRTDEFTQTYRMEHSTFQRLVEIMCPSLEVDDTKARASGAGPLTTELVVARCHCVGWTERRLPACETCSEFLERLCAGAPNWFASTVPDSNASSSNESRRRWSIDSRWRSVGREESSPSLPPKRYRPRNVRPNCHEQVRTRVRYD